MMINLFTRFPRLRKYASALSVELYEPLNYVNKLKLRTNIAMEFVGTLSSFVNPRQFDLIYCKLF